MPITIPDQSEAAPYYFTYIDRVPAGDIVEHWRGQEAEVVAFALGIADAQAGHRYAPDKWSIREVLGHVNDCERLFVGRAFWFARGALSRAGRPSLSLRRRARAALARERGSTAFGVEPGLGRSASRAVALRPAASKASSPAPERSDWVPCSPKASPVAVERYLSR